jgi:hypothetical protein
MVVCGLPQRLAVVLASILTVAAPPPGFRVPAEACAWGGTSAAACDTDSYRGEYPLCALFSGADGSPIPCQGRVGEPFCEFEGLAANSTPPRASSWHVHVFLPNAGCRDCAPEFSFEAPGFTFSGGMEFRRDIAEHLNLLGRQIAPQSRLGQINTTRALIDPGYDQCSDEYDIVAGAPASYLAVPCIFEVDTVKTGGPFTDPRTGRGYPNFSFLIPGETWLPRMLLLLREWIVDAQSERFRKYPVLIHPNTGCEKRDHGESRRSVARWWDGHISQ